MHLRFNLRFKTLLFDSPPTTLLLPLKIPTTFEFEDYIKHQNISFKFTQFFDKNTINFCFKHIHIYCT